MKKAKLVLITLFMLATVGGILAFKAYRFHLIVFKTTTATYPGGVTITICKLLPDVYNIAPNAPLWPSVYTTLTTTTTTIPTTFCSLSLRLTIEE